MLTIKHTINLEFQIHCIKILLVLDLFVHFVLCACVLRCSVTAYCVHVMKPDINTGCLSFSLSTFYFETASLTHLGHVHWLDCLFYPRTRITGTHHCAWLLNRC